jgi:hypothetical protein
MTQEVDKKLILLQEYKEGFSEIQKLVNSFDAIQSDSQEAFLNERQYVLNEQLKFLNEQRHDVFLEVRSFLARVNSRLKTLIDTENYLKAQLQECETFNELINLSSGNDSKLITKEKI